MVFNFLGADFVGAKSDHRREKKPVLRPILHTRRESDVHKTFRRRTSKCLIRIQSKN